MEFIVKKQKNEIDKKVLGQDKNFSKRLPYANEKIREIHFSKTNMKYETIGVGISPEQMTNLKNVAAKMR